MSNIQSVDAMIDELYFDGSFSREQFEAALTRREERIKVEACIDELSSATFSYAKELRRMKHHYDIGNLTEKGIGSYEENLRYEKDRLYRIGQLEQQLKTLDGQEQV